MGRTKHPTVRVSVGERVADIDYAIAELVEQIWIAGIDTANSCQENRPGIAWLSFPAECEASDFLNIVAGSYSDQIESLYNRIRLEWTDPEGTIPGEWCYSVNPWDASIEQTVNGEFVEERSVGKPHFLFAVSIRFPIEDIPELVRRLKEFNARW